MLKERTAAQPNSEKTLLEAYNKNRLIVKMPVSRDSCSRCQSSPEPVGGPEDVEQSNAICVARLCGHSSICIIWWSGDSRCGRYCNVVKGHVLFGVFCAGL